MRRALELYAEGELLDPASVERVRSHLEDCDACADYLAFYDELTGSLLAAEAPEHDAGAGVERVVEALPAAGSRRPLPGPRAAAAPPAAPAPRARAAPRAAPRAAFARPPARAPQRVLLRLAVASSLAAAAAVLIACLPGLWRSSVDRAGAGAARGGYGRLDSLPSLADALPSPEPERAATAIAGASRAREQERTDLRWILDEDSWPVGAAGLGRAGALLRLRGFRPGSTALPSPGEEPEPATVIARGRGASEEPECLVVDALPGSGSRVATGEKLFLVPEVPSADSAAPVEIDPVTWYAARDAGRRRGTQRGDATIYRVYVLQDLRFFALPLSSQGDGLLRPGPRLPGATPVLDASRAGARWTVPASWR